MKVTFVLNSTNAGGAEGHTLRLAAHLSQRHDVQVLALREPDQARASNTDGLEVSFCPEAGLVGTQRWLRKALEESRSGVVISVNLKPLVMVQACGVPRHLSIFHSFPSHLSGQGLKAAGDTVFWLMAATLMAPRVSKFVYVSSMQQRAWRMIPPFAFRRGVVIRNGVTIPLNAGCKPPSAALRIGMVAAFRREKNHRLLLDALVALRRRNIPFEVAFAGDGPLRAETERRAIDLGLEGYVTFRGSLRNCEEIYRWADVTVLPSTAETLPLVIAESMSFATPVVASDVGGNREIVANGENGILFPSGSVDSLIEALLAMTSQGRREEFGARARKQVIELFSAEEMFSRYERQFIDID